MCFHGGRAGDGYDEEFCYGDLIQNNLKVKNHLYQVRMIWFQSLLTQKAKINLQNQNQLPVKASQPQVPIHGLVIQVHHLREGVHKL